MKSRLARLALVWLFMSGAFHKCLGAQEACQAPVYGDHCITGSETWSARLLTDLFGTQDQIRDGTAHYTKDIRPATEWNETLQIDIEIYIKSLTELNDAEQTLETSIWWETRWVDPFLKWDPEEYGGVPELGLQNHEDVIWWPIFEVRTGVEAPHESMGNEHHTFVLSNTGLVSFFEQRSIKSACTLSVKDFPFDRQHCIIEVGDFKALVKEYEFSSVMLNPASMQASLAAWETTDASARGMYECYNRAGVVQEPTLQAAMSALPVEGGEPECSTFVEIRVEFKRYSEPYVSMSIIPVAFVTFLTFISFQLPSGGGERTGLIITALLTVVAVMFITAEKLPDTKEITVLYKFNKAMVLLNLVVMIEAGLVSVLVEYKIEIDIRERHLEFMYPEIWASKLWRMLLPHSNSHKVDAIDVYANEKSETTTCMSLQEVRELSVDDVCPNAYDAIAGILFAEKMPDIMPALAVEGLVDPIRINGCTPQMLKDSLGINLGRSMRLHRAANMFIKTDNIVLIADVVDRLCLFTFPILWLVAIEVILGDHLHISDVLWGLAPST
ncbi:hypothetical protein CYMTET_51935 [Cymbomonas tetramitiformis]|uniref:Uncharacterized protein n=1 Tax=Cymbomonas tetramitiformis TaxID=36881 RepID=A0AAE0BLG0_9CHLO|nr:hypothetical protein CYMTET_51935 [Cymbomonas tetramitiformis]